MRTRLSDITPTTNMPTASDSNGPCPLLDNLPRELRDRIYDALLTPTPHILIQHETIYPRESDPEGNIFTPDYYFGGDLPPKDSVKWEKCLMGILLVNKQIYAEIMEAFYQKMIFVFGAPDQTISLLLTVPKLRLDSIRSITVVYDDQRHGFSPEPTKDSWIQIVKSLPNVEDLTIFVNLPVTEGFDRTVPDFADLNSRFTVDDIENLRWLQDVKVFRLMDKIKTSRVEITGAQQGEEYLASLWIHREYEIPDHLGPFATKVQAEATVCARWTHWYRTLHRSLGNAINDYIRGKPLRGIWDEHLSLLERFDTWKREPYELTGLYEEPEGKKITYFGGVVYV